MLGGVNLITRLVSLIRNPHLACEVLISFFDFVKVPCGQFQMGQKTIDKSTENIWLLEREVNIWEGLIYDNNYKQTYYLSYVLLLEYKFI